MTDVDRRACIDCQYPLVGLRDTRCPECGRLFDPNDPDTYREDVGGLEKLFVGDTASDTHLLKDILMDAGIKAVVLGDALDMANGLLPGSLGMLPAVWVGAHDVEKATAIAAEFATTRREIPSVVSEDWACPACGEQIEGQFSTCWNCGTDHPTPVE